MTQLNENILKTGRVIYNSAATLTAAAIGTALGGLFGFGMLLVAGTVLTGLSPLVWPVIGLCAGLGLVGTTAAEIYIMKDRGGFCGPVRVGERLAETGKSLGRKLLHSIGLGHFHAKTAEAGEAPAVEPASPRIFHEKKLPHSFDAAAEKPAPTVQDSRIKSRPSMHLS